MYLQHLSQNQIFTFWFFINESKKLLSFHWSNSEPCLQVGSICAWKSTSEGRQPVSGSKTWPGLGATTGSLINTRFLLMRTRPVCWQGVGLGHWRWGLGKLFFSICSITFHISSEKRIRNVAIIVTDRVGRVFFEHLNLLHLKWATQIFDASFPAAWQWCELASTPRPSLALLFGSVLPTGSSSFLFQFPAIVPFCQQEHRKRWEVKAKCFPLKGVASDISGDKPMGTQRTLTLWLTSGI